MSLAPLAAALLALALALPVFAGPAGAPAAPSAPQPQNWPAASETFVNQFKDAKARMAQAFLTGQPVEQALTSQVFGTLSGLVPFTDQPPAPNGLTPEQAHAQIDSLIHIKEQAMAVQAGRRPDDPPVIFRQAIAVAAEGVLGRKATEQEAQTLVRLYGDKSTDPRAPQRQKSQGELMMDAEAARRLLADPHLNPQLAGQVTAKTGEYARALGGLLFTDGAGNAVIVGRRNVNAPLTQGELDHIASMPRVQLPSGLSGLDKKVPTPVSAISEDAPQMGQPGFEYGWATGAYKHWDDIAKAQDDLVSNGQRGPLAATAVYTGATIMKGFMHMGGLMAVEQSYNQLHWDQNRDASTGTLVWSGTKLVGNTALAALNFVPVAGAISKGGGLLRTTAAGTEITELAGGAGREAAAASAGEIRTIIANSASRGSMVSTNDARTILSGLRDAGAGKGIKIVEDRSLLGMGMAEGDASNVVINTRMGAAHEVTHAVQQAQVRFTLLRQMGVENYNELSEAQKALFAQRVNAVETQAYNQFEQGAFRATGFMGSGKLNGARYAQGLEQNVAGFETALANGTVPQIGARVWQRPTMWAYGELPNLLGRSQAQIMWNLGATVSMSRPLAPYMDQAVGAGVDGTMRLLHPEWYQDTLPAPAPARRVAPRPNNP